MNLFWVCYLRSLPSLDRRYRALCDRAALHGFAWLRQAPSRGFGAVPSCSGHCRLLYLHRLLRVDVFQFWLGWQLGANSTICWAHLILNLRLQNSSPCWKRGNFASLCSLCQDKPCTIFLWSGFARSLPSGKLLGENRLQDVEARQRIG